MKDVKDNSYWMSKRPQLYSPTRSANGIMNFNSNTKLILPVQAKCNEVFLNCPLYSLSRQFPCSPEQFMAPLRAKWDQTAPQSSLGDAPPFCRVSLYCGTPFNGTAGTKFCLGPLWHIGWRDPPKKHLLTWNRTRRACWQRIHPAVILG